MQGVQTKNPRNRINKGKIGCVRGVQIPLSLLKNRINKGFRGWFVCKVFKKVCKPIFFILANLHKQRILEKGKSEWCQIFPPTLQIAQILY